MRLIKSKMEDIYQFFYNSETNLFTDECGFIVFNLCEIIQPNIIFLFKKEKRYRTVIDITGKNLVELFYD